jgi:hypothetical protein
MDVKDVAQATFLLARNSAVWRGGRKTALYLRQKIEWQNCFLPGRKLRFTTSGVAGGRK